MLQFIVKVSAPPTSGFPPQIWLHYLVIPSYKPGTLLLPLILTGLALTACSQPPRAVLTFTAERRSPTHALSASGTLEAKRKHTVSTPRISGVNPELVYLVPEGTRVAKDDVVAAFDESPLVISYLQARNDLAIARAESKQKEAELRSRRFSLEAGLKGSRSVQEAAKLKERARGFLAPRLRKLEEMRIRVAELQARKLSAQLESLGPIETEERRHSQLKIEQANRNLEKAQKGLDDLALKAPVDGIFQYGRNPMTGNKIQQGDVLYGGFPVGNIPDLSALQIKLQVGEIESRLLKRGQAATVSVSALGISGLPAHVSVVAPIARPVKRGSRVKQREVTVELDSTVSGLRPGLTAECRILIEERDSVVTVPLDCLFTRDTSRIVYVWDGKRFSSRPVTLSGKGENFAWIDSGLVGGESLALREPEDVEE